MLHQLKRVYEHTLTTGFIVTLASTFMACSTPASSHTGYSREMVWQHPANSPGPAPMMAGTSITDSPGKRYSGWALLP
jgi:hypothetical protein